MPGKYTNDEEKAHIFSWKQENVPVKVICRRSGKGCTASSGFSFIEIPNNTVLKHKFGKGGKKRYLD